MSFLNTRALARAAGAAGQWTDVAPALSSPPRPVKAPPVGEGDDLGLEEDAGATELERMMVETIEGKPEDVARKRMLMRRDGANVRMLVRPHDYRLLRLELPGGGRDGGVAVTASVAPCHSSAVPGPPLM